MSERDKPLERLLHKVEENIAEAREEERARQVEADAEQEELWEEAAQRERLLAQEIEHEEGRGEPGEEPKQSQEAVFVFHSEEAGSKLEELAGKQARIVGVVKGSGSYGHAGVKGSWITFEDNAGDEESS